VTIDATRHEPQQERQLSALNPKSVVDEVTDSLRNGIESRLYPPGTHLVERSVAQALGVSSIAVREAFVRLANEGVVVQKPRRGTFVASFSADAVLDLARVRIALEQLVVGLAAANWTAEATATVQATVDEMYEAAEAGDAERFFALDSRFHDTFWRIAGSPILLEIASLLRGRLSGFIRHATLRRSHEQLIEAATTHQVWLDAVATGNVELARNEVDRQIMMTFEQISASLVEPGMGAST
jgi:DNA-binding GntR family transcriptional regulator